MELGKEYLHLVLMHLDLVPEVQQFWIELVSLFRELALFAIFWYIYSSVRAARIVNVVCMVPCCSFSSSFSGQLVDLVKAFLHTIFLHFGLLVAEERQAAVELLCPVFEVVNVLSPLSILQFIMDRRPRTSQNPKPDTQL